MNLDVVSFPALLVAEDGWVQVLVTRDRLDAWTPAEIRRYSKRRGIIYDHCDCAWQVESIAPQNRLSVLAGLAHSVLNSKLPVQIQVQPIPESPMQYVQEILSAAIDADDNILTQATEVDDLKTAVSKHARDRSPQSAQSNESRGRPIDETPHVEKIEEATEALHTPMDGCLFETFFRDGSQKIPDIKMCHLCGWNVIQVMA
jgi:hypothetical protein